MARRSWPSVTLLAACALTLGACSKHVDSTATAPGSAGTNSAELVRPAAPDGPAGGSRGTVGSLRAPGSSGGKPMAGATGSGSAVTGSGLKPPPGVGLNGGLGGTSVMGSSPSTNSTTAPLVTPGSNGSSNVTPGINGSANMTPGSAVGTRP